jgi:hypothetical protein
MSNVWERFNEIATAEEVLEAKTQFEPLDAGTYKMKLLSIEPSENKDGLPMVKGKFQTEEGKSVFYNQMLQNLNNPRMTSVNISEAIKFIEGLTGEEYAFINLGKLAEQITLINGQYKDVEYIIDASYGAKDVERKFPKLKITGFADPDRTPF